MNEQHAHFQVDGLMELGNLAVNNDNNQEMITQLGGISRIVSAMKDHPMNAYVQEYGCAALQKLAENENNKVVIADEEGIARIVSAMRTHPNNANVQEYGCAALRCLAENNEKNRVMIVKAGGKVTIACALQHNKSNVCVGKEGHTSALHKMTQSKGFCEG